MGAPDWLFREATLTVLLRRLKACCVWLTVGLKHTHTRFVVVIQRALPRRGFKNWVYRQRAHRESESSVREISGPPHPLVDPTPLDFPVEPHHVLITQALGTLGAGSFCVVRGLS